jgi:hypothetical protein
MLSMHWISFPANADRAYQSLVLGFILALSRLCLRHFVPSLPRLSKSKKRITSGTLMFCISQTVSRKDFPPVLTVNTAPFTPKSRKALTSFFPSTTMGLPFEDSSANFSRISRILSSFSFSFVDKALYLVTLARRTASKHSCASRLFAKYLRTGSRISARSAATPFLRSCGCNLPSA